MARRRAAVDSRAVPDVNDEGEARVRAGDSRYHPLRDRLRQDGGPEVRLSFAVLEQLIPGGLPPSARRWRVWWQNDGDGSHVQARSWLEAGYRVESVELPNGPVVLRRNSL